MGGGNRGNWGRTMGTGGGWEGGRMMKEQQRVVGGNDEG